MIENMLLLENMLPFLVLTAKLLRAYVYEGRKKAESKHHHHQKGTEGFKSKQIGEIGFINS